ncbi:MAG: molybdopterin-dependent oxidoreductase [Tepidimonas sp.]|uniref:molybdopterin-dependent oxidoreductase n=1 Tax=Tepidimonas sp. TaxID=2002775 RepID=UPI00298F2B0C|nr:molybdopterin-dependent oxidoreductase [Tepidimonas sp.]MCS6810530.1 molybdopterin-dependent oxidoreductase [Tepidimonas sp.]MDW8335542.1 molybdopterin-dependent oxidoreductase [Tepidimonas sp.]
MNLAFPLGTRRHALAVLLAYAAVPWPAGASPLPKPKGRVVLTVEGAIERRNQGAQASFDLAMLEALPQHRFVTRTPWDDGPVAFSGPRLRDLLAAVGARGQQLRATALNDYRVVIPIDDAQRFDVIVATRKNDAPMAVREKGPLFIVYPFDSDPVLRDKRYYERSIWQLKALVVE